MENTFLEKSGHPVCRVNYAHRIFELNLNEGVFKYKILAPVHTVLLCLTGGCLFDDPVIEDTMMKYHFISITAHSVRLRIK